MNTMNERMESISKDEIDFETKKSVFEVFIRMPENNGKRKEVVYYKVEQKE